MRREKSYWCMSLAVCGVAGRAAGMRAGGWGKIATSVLLDCVWWPRGGAQWPAAALLGKVAYPGVCGTVFMDVLESVYVCVCIWHVQKQGSCALVAVGARSECIFVCTFQNWSWTCVCQQ